MIAPFEMAHGSHVLACVPCWVKIFYAYMSFLHLVGRRLKIMNRHLFQESNEQVDEVIIWHLHAQH